MESDSPWEPVDWKPIAEDATNTAGEDAVLEKGWWVDTLLASTEPLGRTWIRTGGTFVAWVVFAYVIVFTYPAAYGDQSGLAFTLLEILLLVCLAISVFILLLSIRTGVLMILFSVNANVGEYGSNFSSEAITAWVLTVGLTLSVILLSKLRKSRKCG